MVGALVHKNAVDGSSMLGVPLVIADSERDMPELEPEPLGWYGSTLTTGLKAGCMLYQRSCHMSFQM